MPAIGDWICCNCAHDIGFDVGVEGHEWKDLGEATPAHAREADESIALDDSDDDDAGIPRARRKKQRSFRSLDDSDDEIMPSRKKRACPVNFDSSDEDD